MKAAIDAGYADNPDIKNQIQEATERILSSVYFQENLSAGPVPDEKTLRDYYEDNKDEKFTTEATAEARQIVVETEQTARSVREMIVKGEIDFEKAVEIYSIDQSKENKGVIGPVRENGFIRGIGRSKPFIEMVLNLKAEEVSEPFKTRIGWHLVQLIKKTNAGYQSFDQVKSNIADELLVTDADIRKEYAASQSDYLARARCKLSHILLNTQEDAEKVYAEMQGGKDFVYLVKTYSTDQQSVKQDGNLGYLYKGGYIRGIGKDAEFEAQVFTMKLGQISKPIKSRKGWHIVRVDEKEEESVKPLVEVENQIRQKLIREKKENYLENRFKEMEEKYQTQIFEDRIKAKTDEPSSEEATGSDHHHDHGHDHHHHH